MTSNNGTQLLRKIGLTVSMLLIGWLSPGLGRAAVQKVDVCHRDDTGGFHLMTVAAQAIPAHRAHGDALPGELVPGNPGLKFDGTCGEVAASSCPCNFSLSNLASVGIDPPLSAGECDANADTVHISGQTAGGLHFQLQAADVASGATGCGISLSKP